MAQRDGLNTRERRRADPPQLPDPRVFPPFNRSHMASQGNPSQKFCTKITILLFHIDKQTTVLTKHYSKQSFAVSQKNTACNKEQHKELVGVKTYRLSSSVYPLSSFVFTFCFVFLCPALSETEQNITSQWGCWLLALLVSVGLSRRQKDGAWGQSCLVWNRSSMRTAYTTNGKLETKQQEGNAAFCFVFYNFIFKII